jgi:hypothetical protein
VPYIEPIQELKLPDPRVAPRSQAEHLYSKRLTKNLDKNTGYGTISCYELNIHRVKWMDEKRGMSTCGKSNDQEVF